MFTCCINFLRNKKRNNDHIQLNKNIKNHLGSLDWSDPVIIKTISINYITEIVNILEVDETDQFIVPPILNYKNDFKNLFALAYQKCLYGPLTSVPRPLK